eukprot:Rmarinus@m.14010
MGDNPFSFGTFVRARQDSTPQPPTSHPSSVSYVKKPTEQAPLKSTNKAALSVFDDDEDEEPFVLPPPINTKSQKSRKSDATISLFEGGSDDDSDSISRPSVRSSFHSTTPSKSEGRSKSPSSCRLGQRPTTIEAPKEVVSSYPTQKVQQQNSTRPSPQPAPLPLNQVPPLSVDTGSQKEIEELKKKLQSAEKRAQEWQKTSESLQKRVAELEEKQRISHLEMEDAVKQAEIAFDKMETRACRAEQENGKLLKELENLRRGSVAGPASPLQQSSELHARISQMRENSMFASRHLHNVCSTTTDLLQQLVQGVENVKLASAALATLDRISRMDTTGRFVFEENIEAPRSSAQDR